MSNLGLENAIKKLGVEFVRVPVGDRYIISELGKRQWDLGGEPSGHIVSMKMTTTGDGIITALQVLAAMRHQNLSLAEISSGFIAYPQVLLNVKIAQQDISLENARIQQAIKDVESKLGEKGRVLLRRSGTEAVIRVMVEGEDEVKVKQAAERLADVVKKELGE
jgi:phosphoglucosamine mutase